MASKAVLSEQKLRGGYYTPQPIAHFLSAWAIMRPDATVVEPSCGDGNILSAAAEELLNLGATPREVASQLTGVEFDQGEAEKAHRRLWALGVHGSAQEEVVHNADFFAFCQDALIEDRWYDAVVGNPPFVRYQDFLEEHRARAFGLMRQAGLNPNRLTNSWVPFLVASSLLLSRGGRLAMVIPAELFQVNYAAEVRKFLSDYYRRITIITFRELVFDTIQQEVVLLLCERAHEGSEGIRVIELDGLADLAAYEHRDFGDEDLRPIDHNKDKWTQYYLTTDEILLLRTLRSHTGITKASEVLDVDVGVVTGQNRFFVLTAAQVAYYQLENFVQPIVGRSAHLKGTCFSEEDWCSNVSSEVPTFLFMPPNVPARELPESAQQYIALGEREGFHSGYKCSIRRNWHVVPSVWTPDAFMLRQIHGFPKLVLNETKATCTDTLHRVRFLKKVDPKSVTAGFINSLTFAFSEVTGRGYGGGVQTFEPSEAEHLLLPLNCAEQLDFDEIDRLVRAGEIDKILDLTDRVLLREGLGLSAQDTRALRSIWTKLRDRRIMRR